MPGRGTGRAETGSVARQQKAWFLLAAHAEMPGRGTGRAETGSVARRPEWPRKRRGLNDCRLRLWIRPGGPILRYDDDVWGRPVSTRVVNLQVRAEAQCPR